MNIHLSRITTVQWRAGLAIATAISIALLASGCSSHAAPQAAMPAPEVSIAQVLVKPVRQWDEFTGRVAAVETVELRPRVSGYVERVAYSEGQQVNKGDLLFVIDQRPYRATLAHVTADLARARSEAQLAKSQSARARSLVAVNAISQEEADTRTAAVAQGDASVRAAEAAVTSAELDLQFTEVRSPIAGRTGRAMITAGNLARADQTLLTTVVSLDPMHVNFESDERAFLGYQELARNGERTEMSNAVRVGLANEEGYPHLGKVDFIDNGVDARTGTIHARAVLPNADGSLTPGLFARVQLEGAAEAEAVLIDPKAVLTDQDRKYVYVVGADNKAMRKDIVTGRLVDDLRVVTSGLDATDRVVIRGVQKVFFPGMPVQPTVIAMQAPTPTDPVAMK
ncbi:MAG: efflux RND transporter periplasmic adaptor subunit [Dokdonella sp.]|uniref:efflux RND transporter periplasmic adaptor subunit n=1 Tax=Dokdonella sp. TaxID=2291710 RepID=UPI003BB0E8C3